jgi:hypothetical protein
MWKILQFFASGIYRQVVDLLCQQRFTSYCVKSFAISTLDNLFFLPLAFIAIKYEKVAWRNTGNLIWNVIGEL